MRVFYLIFLGVFLFNITSCTPTMEWEQKDWDPAERQWLLSQTNLDSQQSDTSESISQADQSLLEKFQPRIFISPNGLPPIDFYDFYLPQSVVRDKSQGGRVIRNSVNRSLLKQIERNRRLYLDYEGQPSPCSGSCEDYQGIGYGRVYREDVSFKLHDGNTATESLIFLKYNYVFTFSGLPAELPWFKEWGAQLLGDIQQWHELDNHGSIHIVLTSDHRPIAIILGQHLYFRTYIVGREVFWPTDNRASICFAERSNEPHLCNDASQPSLERVVGNPTDFHYLIDGRNPPLASGFDKVYSPQAGGIPIPHTLKFLPKHDPLYTSWIPLGDRKKILGIFSSIHRQGPPGMMIKSLFDFKSYGDILQFWYSDNTMEDSVFWEKLSSQSIADIDIPSVRDRNGQKFYQNLRQTMLMVVQQ